MFISEVETEAIKAMSADQGRRRRRRNSEAQEPRTKKKKNLQPPFREDVLKFSRKPDLHQVRGGAQERESIPRRRGRRKENAVEVVSGCGRAVRRCHVQLRASRSDERTDRAQGLRGQAVWQRVHQSGHLHLRRLPVETLCRWRLG